MKGFWKEILTSNNSTSSKRLVTLVIALHFILSSFVTLFIAFYVIFYKTKGSVDKDLLDLLKEVLEYDFFIIISGLGFITAENLGAILVAKFRGKRGGWGDFYNNDYPFHEGTQQSEEQNKPNDI